MILTAVVMSALTGRGSSRPFPAIFERGNVFAGKFPHFLAGFCAARLFKLAFRSFWTTMPTQIENLKNAGPVLKVVKLTDQALIPTKGSKHAAGYDLYSAYDYVIPAMSNMLVKTDLQIAVPHGCYGRVAPRSGLALKNFIDVGAGVVDEDYRGNLGVVLFNFSKESFKVSRGERVAQLICEKIEYPEIQEMKSLEETERGEGGFGSTGIN